MGRLGSDRGAIVSACSGNHPAISIFFCIRGRERGTPVLKASGGVASLVLDENSRPITGLAVITNKLGDVVQLDQWSISHRRGSLYLRDFLNRKFDLRHESLIVKTDALMFKGSELDASRTFEDFFPAAENCGVAIESHEGSFEAYGCSWSLCE